ncbi:STAS domain-containing protein [Streptosporangium sp. NPDC051023]|uniref:STAS domain-containing protein n=1 Tax=Streptosporangium sp. NPDC051023 TaxID=3155410 RepID=UPI00344F0C94
MSDLHLETSEAELSATDGGTAGVVVINGAFDHALHAPASLFLDEVFAAFGPYLILDLSGLDLLDSRAVGLIVTCWRRATDQDGWFALVGAERGATRILWITGLATRIPIFATVKDALDAQPPRDH